MTQERFDVVVLGMGPGGEVVAGELLTGGLKVAVVERELIGGECAYWACIPSKTLLRPTEARQEATRAAGTRTPTYDWDQVVEYRNYMIRDLDDSAQVESYEEQGATVIKGQVRLRGRGVVEAAGRTLRADHVIIATGSDAAIPSIRGLDGVTYWTNREATNLPEVPGSALIVGGGPVGVELAQMLARFGSDVSLVQSAERLLDREDPRVGELALDALTQDGIDVRVNRRVVEVKQDGGAIEALLDDDSRLQAERLILATGRTPRTHDIGLESVGVAAGENGLDVDDHCRVQDGLWAVGDVTGLMLFMHVAQYQARIVASNLLGHDRAADYRGVPRVVFSDPEVAAVGLTVEAAYEQGLNVTSSAISLPQKLARPWTYEQDPRGEQGLVADKERHVLIGAWAVSPLASEWIHWASLAIKARVPIDTLLDTVPQFPTYSEAYLAGLRALSY